MRVPVRYLNEDDNIDLKRGCYVVHINKLVTCKCAGNVPETIDIDISGMKKGDVLKLSQVVLPEGVQPIFNGMATDTVLCKIESG
jgi:large subunit ribosomal protein L25